MLGIDRHVEQHFHRTFQRRKVTIYMLNISAKKSDYLRQMNIKAILDFFIKTEIHDHCAYLIDSLWEHTTLLKDWKTMTTLLLDPNPLIGEPVCV